MLGAPKVSAEMLAEKQRKVQERKGKVARNMLLLLLFLLSRVVFSRNWRSVLPLGCLKKSVCGEKSWKHGKWTYMEQMVEPWCAYCPELYVFLHLFCSQTTTTGPSTDGSNHTINLSKVGRLSSLIRKREMPALHIYRIIITMSILQ